jgi:LysM repeat protein
VYNAEMKKIIHTTILIACVVSLVSCQKVEPTQQVISLFPGQELTPYSTNTSTPTMTSTPVNAPTATLPPTVTPTPVTYTVKQGETLFSIAAKRGLTLDQIKAANPLIDPYLLGPGMVIIIPSSSEGEVPATQNPLVNTPYPLSVSDPTCTPSLNGGLYCFVEITNTQQLMAGNITAEFLLTSSESGETLSQKALMPLSRIATGGSLPLFTYFPPPVMNNPKASIQLLTAMSVNQNGTPTPIQSAVIRIDSPDINISANGLAVAVNGQAVLEAAEGVAGIISVAAVAYDAQDNVVGIRRFVSTNTSNPGESVSFSVNIYSIGGKITRVELFGEANP